MLQLVGWMIPMVIVGSFLGYFLHKHISAGLFEKIILIFVFIVSIRLIFLFLISVDSRCGPIQAGCTSFLRRDITLPAPESKSSNGGC